MLEKILYYSFKTRYQISKLVVSLDANYFLIVKFQNMAFCKTSLIIIKTMYSYFDLFQSNRTINTHLLATYVRECATFEFYYHMLNFTHLGGFVKADKSFLIT